MIVRSSFDERGKDRESLAVSGAGVRSNIKKIRQRAPRACLNCRDLKIKCEQIDNGTNCKRCNYENKQCVFVRSRRGGQNKHKHTGNTTNNQNNQNNNKDNGKENITRIEPEISKRRLEQLQGSPNEFDYISSSITNGTILETGDITYKKHKTDGSISGGGSVFSGDGDDIPRRRQSDDISLRIIQNPSDSLNLLAQAAFNDGSNEPIEDKRRDENASSTDERSKKQITEEDNFESISPTPGNSILIQSSKSGGPLFPSLNDRLGKFCLVKRGIVTPITLKTLISTYFSRHHQYMPVMPVHKILKSDSELCSFAESEPILVVTFVIIASRFEDEKVHAASWKFMSEVIQELVLGIRKPTLGTIEAFLTLAENIPKFKEVKDKELYEFEERFSWNLVGQAVRMSYYLGLDQKTLLETDETMSEETHRMRFIWTYCHFEECQTSIRFGKALWTRGPTLCFPSSYVNSSFSSFHNFRTLIPSVNSTEDHSSYMQALIDCTNIMSNIHDLLYPSRDRTISLVHLGDYHKILDEFTMAFANYKMTWEKKNWDILALNETVWISFHYARLYAYGFAFEAHMKRMTESSREKLDAQNVFPMSMMATPDAKFIIEAKNAAVLILTSCANNLRTYGAMAYLPARYYGYFGHSAVFLIKIIFTGAVNFTERREILDLIGKVIACFCDEFKGLDRFHPLIRCAQQLRILLQTLWPSKSQECSGDNNKSSAESNTDNPYYQEQRQYDPLMEDSLAGEIFNLVDNFLFDSFSPDLIRDSAETAAQDLATTFSNDLNSDFWLSYFN